MGPALASLSFHTPSFLDLKRRVPLSHACRAAVRCALLLYTGRTQLGSFHPRLLN